MDNLTLAQKIFANQKPKEEEVNKENTSSTSIIYMVAVTSSSGGEVVLRNETESLAEWEEGSYLEIDDEGDFEEYEDEDSLEDVNDSVIDLTDGDGVDIEDDDTNTVAFTVARYKTKAIQVYATEMEVEEEPLSDGEISDEIDDGDAEEIPEEDAEEYPLEDGEITELGDEDYGLIDANEDDESDIVEDAEVSDGYTVAECIGAVNEGDRVAVAVQNGKLIVLGVVGSGDQQRAMTDESQKTADEALEGAEKAKELVRAAEEASERAAEKAELAEISANQAVQDAQDAKNAAVNAEEKANSVAGNAQTAVNTANAAKTEAESASEVANAAKTDAAKALEDAANAAENVVKLESTIAADYTKKTDFVSVKADFETRITQNANDISLNTKKITEVDETANNAKELADGASAKADEAKSKADLADTDAKAAKLAADTAQQAADDAQTKATTAQQAADDAKTAADTAEEKLAEAKAELAEVQSRVGVTEEEIADAQAKVDSAQTAADKAQADATNAQLAADTAKSDAAKAQTAAAKAQTDANTAQAAADMAKQAADKAQADADALAKRVTTAEASIKQNADSIALTVKKMELATTLSGYYTKTETESLIKAESDSITLKVNAETSARESDTAALQASLALKVNTKDLISEINASADVITLNSNRLIVNSDNFKLSEDGTLEAVNGKFSGILTCAEGTIAGFTISDTAIYKGPDWLNSSEKGIYIGIDGILARGDADSEVISSVRINNGWIKCENDLEQTVTISGDGITLMCSDLTSVGGRVNETYFRIVKRDKVELSGAPGEYSYILNEMAEIDMTGIHSEGEDILCWNGLAKLSNVYSLGTNKLILELLSAKGNLTIGKGLYEDGSADTGIYGNDVYIYAKNSAGTPGGFRPYIGAETVTISIQTAGYVTNNGKTVYFIVPRCKPLAGSGISVSAASLNGFTLRQDGKYTHGSGSSTYTKPTSYSCTLYAHGFTLVKATFDDTTNAVNNAPIGVTWNGTLTFT